MAWLTIFHGDEKTYWKTMTPRRMDVLLTQYAGRQTRKEKRSLSEYLFGGG